MSEKQKRRACADERNALMNFAVGVDATGVAIRQLERRLKEEGKWGSVKGAFGMIKSAYTAMLESLPIEQVKTVNKNLCMMVWEYHVKNVMGKSLKDDGLWMPLDKLDEIVDAARDRCLSCMKSTDEARKCVLSKAFDLLPLNNEDETLSGCKYYFEV